MELSSYFVATKGLKIPALYSNLDLFRERRGGFPFQPRPRLCCGLAAGRRKLPNKDDISSKDDIGKTRGNPKNDDVLARTVEDIEIITIGEVLEEAVNT